MDDVIKVTLAKYFSKKLKDNDIVLNPGLHNVDTTISLKISGNINKLEDVDYTPTVDNVPLLPTLALVLEKSGFQRENIKRMLIAAMCEALELEEKGKEYIRDKCRDVEAAMQHVREITTALPKKVKSGATLLEINIQELQPV